MDISNKQPVPLCAGVHVITGVTNIGVIADYPAEPADGGKSAAVPDLYLIDSGADGDAAKKIYKTLESLYPEGFTLKAVICTHSNADHIGGNDWFQKHTGCGVWASLGERGSIEHTVIEAAIIWGGYPFAEITGKRYVARPSRVTRVIGCGETVRLAGGAEISFISLPGHYLDMIGVLYTAGAPITGAQTDNEPPRRVLFLGDCIFGRHVIKKYWIPFLFDVGQFKRTLDTIKTVPADAYVPSHGDVLDSADSLEALAELNMIAIMETEVSILAVLKEEKTAEELLQAVADLNRIELADGQYVLIGCTLRSYLSYLHGQKKIGHYIRGNKMYWKRLESNGSEND
ncbi:MBL fold metallo-hydrolase [Treponema brennaborense]|uniref:Beta-lactamase n=1 Tax=Treponema brennaborense (strain DSM 12168 / CIP 105900 / DD5/3) TaxID=906968 RepID=F4LPN7_TREBD|nr:MBL fold metallo-hydrolase [Treponema brennaborense]AEE17033.1 beta-lactamase [Treponema brennaborense DSM 12168]